MNAHAQETPYQAEGPQPLLRPIIQGLPYPVASLGPLRTAAEAVQGMTQAPLALPAASALAVASLAVMGFADVETLDGERPTALYVLTIAQSGERKTSCDARFMEALREHERDQDMSRRDDVTAWKDAQALWKGDRDRILTDANKGKGDKRTAAEADLAAMGPEPQAPPSADRTVAEPTFEGLTRKYVEGQPALGIFSDEGGQFLGGYAMSADNRQKTLAALNDLWQGNAIRRTRAGEGSVTLYGRRLAIHLMVQPGVARDFMADPKAGDTGFLPRFLICEPTSTIGTRLHANTKRDDLAIQAFADRLRAILATPMPMNPDTRELHPRILPLSDAARALLISFSDVIEAAQAPGGDLSHVKGYASKAAEQAARIAGVLSLWRDLHVPCVTQADMADAICLSQFYLSEASRLADEATVSTETQRAEALRKWLVERWPHSEITLSEITQRAPIRPLRETAIARKAVATLVQAGWLVPLDPGTVVRGSSRKEAYLIVKAAHVV